MIRLKLGWNGKKNEGHTILRIEHLSNEAGFKQFCGQQILQVACINIIEGCERLPQKCMSRLQICND